MNMISIAPLHNGSSINNINKYLDKYFDNIYKYDYRQEHISNLYDIIKNNKIDVAIISKGELLSSKTIKYLKDKGIITVLWVMDSIKNISSFGIEQKHYDIIFTNKYSVYDRYKNNYNIYYANEGVDTEVYYKVERHKIHDVLFIGNKHSDRRNDILRKLKIRTTNRSLGSNHNESVAKTKVNLEITTRQDCSNRVFKIMGAGGFLLTEKWYGLEEEGFIDKIHLVIYNGINDLRNEIKYYVNNDKEREQIAENGYRFVLEHYTMEQYAIKVFNIINQYRITNEQKNSNNN